MMHLTVQKWGNSLALRIPKAVAKQVNVHQGTRVDMSLDANKIVLTAHVVNAYHLSSLLKKINKSNVHQEVEAGKSVGKEIW